MKQFLFSFAALLFSASLFAQGVKIQDGGGNTNPDPAAVLELESSQRGFLPPRMSTSERDAIASPIPSGLRIYNTDTGCENFYNGSSWKQICGECDFASPVLGSNAPVCVGSALSLTASPVSGGTYSWTGPNGFSSSAQNPSVSNVTTGDAGVYSVVVTRNGCSSAAVSISVSVNSAPSLPVAGNDGPVCEGGTVNLTASTLPGVSYSWAGPNGFTSTLQNPTRTGLTLADGGNYTVSATITGCPPAQATTVMAVNTVPGIPTDVTATEGNGQAAVTFTAPSTGGSPITQYTIVSSPGGFTATTSSTSAVVTGLSNGTSYTFTVYATNACGNGGVSSASNSVTPAVPPGCSQSAAFSYKITDDLWLCAPDNITGNNNFVQMASACNNSANFYMATVGPMTRRGLPTQGQISGPTSQANAAGFDLITTGHPTRYFRWDRSLTPYESTNCGSGGTGYIGTSESITADNWLSLVDGNTNELRYWPSANCVEVSYHTLISLCMDASADPLSYIYDYRWR